MAAPVSNDDEMISAINITPLVDIFLVLLIIFMITSSVVTQQQIPLNSPKAAHAGSQAPEAAGLVIDQQGQLYLDGIAMDGAAIQLHLQREVQAHPDYQVLIGADRDLPYQKVVDAIDLVRSAGISKYALKVVKP
jgi:biopolymer transport protein TolR